MKKRVILIIFMLVFLLFLTSKTTGITITGDIAITGEIITGKASSQQTNVSITITDLIPSLTLLSPKNETYISNISLLLNYTATSEQAVWYNLDKGENTTITSHIYFNTSQGSHVLYLYANSTTNSINSTNITFIANSTIFVLNYSEFKGSTAGNSTRFNEYSYEDLQALDSIILENTDYGKMHFLETINLTDDLNPENNNTDLDHYINISSNRIELNSVALTNFNKKATLYLYNLSFDNPRILKDGSVCPTNICTRESYSGNILRFNVTGFSVYSSEETPGSASPTTTPGGGGGGGGIISNIGVSPNQIELSLKQGQTKKQKISIQNLGNQKLIIKIEKSKLDFVKISETSFEVDAGKTKKIDLEFIIKKDTPVDLYIGKIIITSGMITRTIPVKIEVESKKPMFDVRLEIPERDFYVIPGGKISAEINLFRLFGEERVDVNIEFLLKDKEGNTIVSEEETRSVEIQTSFMKIMDIPRDLEPGDYIFYTKVIYGGEIASASSWFSIVSIGFLNQKNLILKITIFIMIILLIYVIYQINRLKKAMRIDEKILTKEKLIKIKKLKGGKER